MTTSEVFFYGCVFVSLLYESLYLFNPEYMRFRRFQFEKAIQVKAMAKSKSKVTSELGHQFEQDHNEDEDPSVGTIDDIGILVSFLSFTALCTCFAGLASSQAPLFLVYLIFCLTVTKLYAKYKASLWLYRLDGLFCSSLLILILLNKFVYHITIYDVWKSL